MQDRENLEIVEDGVADPVDVEEGCCWWIVGAFAD